MKKEDINFVFNKESPDNGQGKYKNSFIYLYKPQGNRLFGKEMPIKEHLLILLSKYLPTNETLKAQKC